MATLRGNIDILTSRRLSGWVKAEEFPEAPVSLLITADGLLVGRVLANRYRPDLEEAGIGDGRHAFAYDYPSELSPLQSHVIRVRRELDGADVPGSPLSLEKAQRFEEVEGFLSRALGSYLSAEDIARKIDFLATQIDKLRQQSADARSVHAQRGEYGNDSSDRAKMAPSSSTPRVLVIDDRLPRPDRDAGSNALLSHIRSLQRLGYAVTIAPSLELRPAEVASTAMELIGVACCCSPHYNSVEEIFVREADGFDIVYLHRISNAMKYGELASQYFPRARRIYSVADLHHIRLMRRGIVENRPDLIALSQRVRLAEFIAAVFSNAVITHSLIEAEVLRANAKGASVFVVPWSVKARPTAVPLSGRRGFAFIGNYEHAPNLDAVRWLIKEIMPLVTEMDSSLHCFLVGSNMPREISEISVEGVTAIGQVAELSEIFDRVRLTVAPLTYGSGVKGKVIDSLAAGVPCICTPISAEGLNLPSSLSGCLAQRPREIASAIVRMHNDERENECCRQAGLDFVRGEFSEERLDSSMRQVLGIGLGSTRAPRAAGAGL